LTEEWLKKLRIGFAKGNDVILTHKGTLGLTAIVPRDKGIVILSPQTTYYRLSDRLSTPFLYYLFQSGFIQKQLHNIGKQSTRDYVGITSQRRLLVPFISVKEQQEIASILCLSDSQITNERNLKSRVENLKKGLMQKLLTGKIRVKV
jgi:type I restriction enzyme, S subunit